MNIPSKLSSETAVFAVVDVTKIQKLTCGMTTKLSNLKRAGWKGLLFVLDSEMFLKNHCRMYEDNHFFTGVINSGNYSKLTNYQHHGKSSKSDFQTIGVLSIHLRDNKANLLEVWTSSMNA